MPLLEALRAQHDFTTTDEVLASYILSHPDEVVRMSVSQLANETYTSSAAVNRLCRKVGSDGFRSFRVDLNTELERERFSSGVSPNLKVSPGEAVTSIMASLSSISRKAIEACSASLDPLELHSAARTVLRAERIVLFAGGDSAVNCEQFANDLERIGKMSSAAYRYESHWATARLVHRGDAALFVSYSGSLLTGLAEQLTEIHKEGAKTIVVTALSRSLLPQKQVDFYLQLPLGEDIMGSAGTFFSQTAMRYALGCLYATAFSLDAETNEMHRRTVTAPDWDH